MIIILWLCVRVCDYRQVDTQQLAHKLKDITTVIIIIIYYVTFLIISMVLKMGNTEYSTCYSMHICTVYNKVKCVKWAYLSKFMPPRQKRLSGV